MQPDLIRKRPATIQILNRRRRIEMAADRGQTKGFQRADKGGKVFIQAVVRRGIGKADLSDGKWRAL
ncbi:hypothetical protein [Ketogulonicigenium vulgare]|uniref:hypothetical protein n=1 Tax=Ketogulonicigenium vulgare TaxID=92945 RepID=UPI002359BB4A|nr:hypothetical protein [Ketogulonicigenium vulgare]